MADLTTKLAKFLASLQGREATILYQTAVTLTDAQVKALPTTPVTVVAAPGANKLLVYVTGALDASFAAGGYTGADATDSYVVIGHTALSELSAYVLNVTGFAGLTSLLNNTRKFVMLPAWMGADVDYGGFANQVNATAVNAALSVAAVNSADFGGGNAANTMKVTVVYAVLDTTTGLFE